MQTIQPYLDASFRRTCFGGRPGHDRFHALAWAEMLATTGNRWVWIVQDVKNAFPSVPRGRLEDVLHRRLPNENLVSLILKLADNGRSRGIPQGAPASPLLLNLYLDYVLDRPWERQHPDLPLLRWIDDLLILTSDRDRQSQPSTHPRISPDTHPPRK